MLVSFALSMEVNCSSFRSVKPFNLLSNLGRICKVTYYESRLVDLVEADKIVGPIQAKQESSASLKCNIGLAYAEI